MKVSNLILSAFTLIPLLSSCASNQKSADSEAVKIRPIFIVRHSTETPNAYYKLGRHYQEQNRYEQALVNYQKAVAIDGTYTEAINGCGVSYAMLGMQQEAIEQFRLAIKQQPNASYLHNNLGYVLFLSGSYAEAVSVLEQAAALEVSNQLAHANLPLASDKEGKNK